MKTQSNRSTLSPYQRISLSMSTAALACVLGTTLVPLRPIYAASAPTSASSATSAAPAPALPASALPEVKPNKEGIYDFTKDTDVKNPFPDVITPAEVKELQDKTKSAYPSFPLIIKSFYTPAGKEFKVVNGKPVGDTREFTYQIQNTYQNMLGRIDNYIFIARATKSYVGEGEIRPYHSSREFTNEDGSLSLDDSKAPNTVIPYTLEINGKFVGKDLTKKIAIQYYMNRNQTFVHMTMHGRKADEIIYGNMAFNYETSSAGPGLFGFIPTCAAEFHFVDDLQYRNVAGIEGADILPQRSAGVTDKFSTKPYIKYNLNDLADVKSIRDVKFINNAIGNYFVPLLSYDGDPKKGSVKRPTMKELTSTNIPGYLYYSNDIDTPEGGTFTENNTEKFGNYDYGIVRDKDDNQVTTKHYYVTYRSIPTQLVVQYKNTENKVEAGKSYALYAGKNPVVDSLTSSGEQLPTAPALSDLQKMIVDKNTTLLPEAAGYSSQGLAYLAPGSYTVTPLAEAPDGYEWVVEAAQAAGTTAPAPAQAATKEMHITAPVHKDDTSALQQVVTFVLRKKIVSVTFKNEGKDYATVAVQQGSSINGDELTDQCMPSNPSKDGFDFAGWNTQPDGKGDAFTGESQVKGNMEVYARYKKKEPPTPTPGSYPLPEPVPVPVPEVPALAATPEPERKVPVIEAPAPAAPADAPAPIVRKRPRALPQTSDPMAISAVGELDTILGAAAGSLAAALRRKRRNR